MASGASSRAHFLEAVLLDAVDADGAALTSDPAEEYVLMPEPLRYWSLRCQMLRLGGPMRPR